MGASQIALEQLLQADALRARKPGSLLVGASARLTRASELTLPARAAAPLSGSAGGPLERLLGPLPKGRLVELVGRRTSGRHSLALAALASVTSAGEPAGLVDLGDHFDPQAAARAGVELERLLWIRPPRVKSALASAEMLLATGFPLVVADLGLSPRGVKFLPDAAWVRLARAAQAQGARLLVVTPWRMSGIAAEAVVAADVARPVWLGSGKSPRLLDGISSRATLEKFGSETPGTFVSIGLRVSEAVRESRETGNGKRETGIAESRESGIGNRESEIREGRETGNGNRETEIPGDRETGNGKRETKIRPIFTATLRTSA